MFNEILPKVESLCTLQTEHKSYRVNGPVDVSEGHVDAEIPHESVDKRLNCRTPDLQVDVSAGSNVTLVGDVEVKLGQRAFRQCIVVINPRSLCSGLEVRRTKDNVVSFGAGVLKQEELATYMVI